MDGFQVALLAVLAVGITLAVIVVAPLVSWIVFAIGALL